MNQYQIEAEAVRRRAATAGRRPQSKFVGHEIDKAEAAVEEVMARGGVAWLEDDYSLNMSGHREWMGYQMKYFDAQLPPYNDIRDIVQYNWEKEALDYEENPDPNHVFLSLMRVRDWLSKEGEDDGSD